MYEAIIPMLEESLSIYDRSQNVYSQPVQALIANYCAHIN